MGYRLATANSFELASVHLQYDDDGM